MRKTCLLILILASTSQTRVSAWGFEAHSFIVDRAIDLLPAPIKPFFDKHRAFLVERAIDPDLWRQAGFDDEPPRHFLDLDAYGAYPFSELPRDYDRAVEKYGIEVVSRNGLLPWRSSEMYGRLRRSFAAVSRGQTWAVNDVKAFAAWLGHYASDAHVPFHAVLNYDGQLTKQDGIHSRFESELFLRYRASLTITPRPVAPVPDARAFIFETLLASSQLAEGVLKADLDAIRGRDEYDGVYFEAFFKATRPVLERRLSESITAVASLITAAWEQAGRPPLPLEPVRTVQKVKR
jgi:hypothetical protein